MGMRWSDIRPAMVMTMAMTMARRGRSTKTAEIMRPGSAGMRRGGGQSRGGGAGHHLHAGAHALYALGDHGLPLRQAADDGGEAWGGLAELHARLLGVVLGRPR